MRWLRRRMVAIRRVLTGTLTVLRGTILASIFAVLMGVAVAVVVAIFLRRRLPLLLFFFFVVVAEEEISEASDKGADVRPQSVARIVRSSSSSTTTTTPPVSITHCSEWWARQQRGRH